MQLNKNIRHFLDLLRFSYFPLPDSEKSRYMAKIKRKVAHYQPLIEVRTGVDLGTITVKEYRFSIDDFFGMTKPKTKAARMIIKPLFELYRMFQEESLNLAACSKNGAIYVPFGITTKSHILWQKHAPDKVIDHTDESVVHELSHFLFRKLGKSDSLKNESLSVILKGSEWEEGFASYCAQTLFLDFYPDRCIVRNSGDLPKGYERGMHKIEKIIELRGKDALFEVPKRWKEFEKELIDYKS